MIFPIRDGITEKATHYVETSVADIRTSRVSSSIVDALKGSLTFPTVYVDPVPDNKDLVYVTVTPSFPFALTSSFISFQ